jgi:putative membrane-bound dehydrogenase-like protein
MKRAAAVLLLLSALAVIPAASPQAQDPGLNPADALARMTVPAGFKATMYASEPEIRQPNAFCIDDRGRLWVAENFSYTGPGGPWKPSGKDSILIFEDTDGDGKHDTRKVFTDKLGFVSGLEVGFGGVWVGSPPNLLFIPDKDGDDQPDGAPQVLLDGWGWQDQHETLNSFIWGPDGWLYGCQGVFTHSRVGKPGTPDSERIGVNAAIWRYHPTRQVFERFCDGTSNPWGLDFDDHGQAFIEACVIPHLWYVIQGARYHRQGGQHFNKHTYDDIKTIADHKHDGIKGRKGGHAHGGARFVLHDQWPAEWRNRFLVGTIHHHGIYTEAFERKGSGFSGKHVDDFMMANDPVYLGFNHDFGPDGSLYVIDWYDPKTCHGQTPSHISTGRIYRIAHESQKRVEVDLVKLPSAELVKLQVSDNEWYVRHGRRILQERGPDAETHRALRSLVSAAPTPAKQLRLYWALYATGGLDEAAQLAMLGSEHEYVRAWGLRLLTDAGAPSEAAVKRFAELAKSDPSAAVRLHVASALQRVAPEQRWEALEALAAHEEDAGDHNLPLMVWYAVEPLVAGNAAKAVAFASKCKLPKVREYVIRRMAAGTGSSIKGPKAAPAESVSEEGLRLKLVPADVKAEGGRVLSWGSAKADGKTQPRVEEKLGGRKAIGFDGNNDRLEFPADPATAFKASEDFTVSLWAHLSDVPAGRWVGVLTKSREDKPWYGLWIDAQSRWTIGGFNANLFGAAAVGTGPERSGSAARPPRRSSSAAGWARSASTPGPCRTPRSAGSPPAPDHFRALSRKASRS